jgi:hypothetical protein
VTRLPRVHRKAGRAAYPGLPLTAEPDLKRVVAYEMNHLTLFRAEQVFWTCRPA